MAGEADPGEGRKLIVAHGGMEGVGVGVGGTLAEGGEQGGDAEA